MWGHSNIIHSPELPTSKSITPYIQIHMSMSASAIRHMTNMTMKIVIIVLSTIFSQFSLIHFSSYLYIPHRRTGGVPQPRPASRTGLGAVLCCEATRAPKRAPCAARQAPLGRYVEASGTVEGRREAGASGRLRHGEDAAMEL